jgi:filamentous hemagglutinin family protein
MNSLISRYATFCAAVAVCQAVMTQPALAQVIADRTVSTNVTAIGNNFTIDQGTRSGNNLFHSFSQFSVPTGGSAIFNHATDVQNIFSRVTGGGISHIDGLIQAQGSANLFLLNPSGLLFGPNASLNIGGSFLGTTANTIKFADGAEFGFANPTALLTMSVPIGLQMGQNPGAITVQNTGHSLVEPSFFAPILQLTPAMGLGVHAGKTMALIGGPIRLEGGVLLAPSGHIELGSLVSGDVGLSDGLGREQFDYAGVQQFADIQLAKQSLVDGSGAPAGSLHLQGQNIQLIEGSVARLQNLAGAALGDLVVDAKGRLEMRQVGTNGFPNNLLTAENLGSGASSNLRITAQRLAVADGGIITTKTFSDGAGGNMTLKIVDGIDLTGWASPIPDIATAIGAATLGSGKGGDLTVDSQSLTIAQGASVLNLTAGSGFSGDMRVQVKDRIELVGENPLILRSSTIANTVLSQGNGGNLTITATAIRLRDGAALGTSTLAAGNGANLMVTATDRIELSGVGVASEQPSRIVAKAELLPALLRQTFGLPDFPTGNAGALVLTTPQLVVRDRAIVGVDNQGQGNAGKLEINAHQVQLKGQGAITAATFSGEGGNLTLNLKTLLSLRDHSAITTTANGNGNGGNIVVNTPLILGLENSDIIANAVKGRGGNIKITTEGILGLKYRAQLTPENDITASSEFGVNGTVQVNTIGIDPNSGLIALPVDIVDPSQHIAAGCNPNQGSSFAITGRGGTPDNPTQHLMVDRTWSDVRPIASPEPARSPNVATIITPILAQATTWQINAQGQPELIANRQHAGEVRGNSATCAQR